MHEEELYYDTDEAIKFISEQTGIDSNIVAKVSRYKTRTYFDGKDMEDDDTKDFKL